MGATRWLAVGGAVLPFKCAAREEGERISWWRGRKEVGLAKGRGMECGCGEGRGREREVDVDEVK